MNNSINVTEEAIGVFNKEIAALEKTRDALGQSFQEILELILHCEGKIILTGIGKPGHIGTKIAATFASLGTPSFFMHPAEAMHGDLGMVQKQDVVLLMSYSGKSEEVTRLLPVLHEIGCATVAITGDPKSPLAKACDYRFIFPQFEEACYMHLAPTSSTTALLALGDALAVVSSRARNYTKKDFALRHPAGALGRKLLVKVCDIMHAQSENAVIRENETLQSAIIEMSGKGLSMVSVVDENMKLRGIITDGDLRRMLQRGVDVYHEYVKNVMTPDPKWVDAREMAVNALQIMNDKRITCLPVLGDRGELVGSVLMQDIIKAGIVR